MLADYTRKYICDMLARQMFPIFTEGAGSGAEQPY